MAENIVQGVAAYMNSYEGGALLIGIENTTNRVVGLVEDYAAACCAFSFFLPLPIRTYRSPLA